MNLYNYELFGRLFHCDTCNKLPSIIREIRNIGDDSLVNIELIDQIKCGCVISYDLGNPTYDLQSCYEIITCGKCRTLVSTIIHTGIKA